MNEVRFRLKGRFGGFRLDAEASLPAVGLTALVGPSGSGKTTLLRCLAGLTRAEGEVVVAGETWQDSHRFLAPHRRGVGYVFQEPSLLPHLTVRQNLAFAARRAPPGDGTAFGEAVEMLGLVELLNRGAGSLSGQA